MIQELYGEGKVAGSRQIVPGMRIQPNAVVLCCGFDVFECLSALGIVHAVDLTETSDRTANVRRVGERLFALAGKGESA